MANTSRPQLPPTPPTEDEQRARNKAPRGAKRKQSDHEGTPQKRQRTSKQAQRATTPPTSASPSSDTLQTSLSVVQEAEDAMDLDESGTIEDGSDELYITVTAANGRRFRKRRAHTHYFIARCGVQTEILDVLDEDPTWSLEEFKRRFKLGLSIGLSTEKTAIALTTMLYDRAVKVLPGRSARVKRAFLKRFHNENEEET